MNLTDAELLELEILLLEKFNEQDLKPIYRIDKNIITDDSGIESALKMNFPDRYTKDEKGNLKMSIHVFKIIQHRYFRHKKVKIIKI